MSNESKTVDATPESQPESLEELVKRAEFATMPDMTRPQDLTVSQSAMLAVTETRYRGRMKQLEQLGAFTNLEQFEDTAESTLLVAESVEYLDALFRSFAVNESEWETWTKGRSVFTLFTLYSVLFTFYLRTLGKSDASKLPSQKIE